uniref:hypothetical protein n=1 Tax=Streptomyces polyasparticus TaxID=2767826 RepID=UPI001F2EE69A|nr:hypothetical protein [Streptomyces polyasparticus]
METDARAILRMQQAMTQMHAIFSEHVLGEGSTNVTLTARQLDLLACVLDDEPGPVAAGLRLILDLDERVCPGQQGCKHSEGGTTL